jgi:hypothetical protein
MPGQRFSSRLIKIASASAIVALRSGLGPRYGYSATQLSNLVALPRPHLGAQAAHASAGGRCRPGQGAASISRGVLWS